MNNTKVTVGINEGDFRGNDNAAIQQAVDSLADTGGVVEILPGEYACIDGVCIRSGVRVIGQGEKTILKKCPGFRSKLAIDADYGQLKITPENVSGFTPGMGISVCDNSHGGWTSSTARIRDIKDGTLLIDNYLKADYQVPKEAFVSNAFSVVKGYHARNASVENLVIEGNRETNFKMDGCRGAAIYWYKSAECSMINCEVRNYNGDGISFQITGDMNVADCRVTGVTSIGLHPGTGSTRATVRNCKFNNNNVGGFFLCWRVQESVFEDITCMGNGDFGISIGHKDTDNSFTRCIMRSNGTVGLRFRQARDTNGAHRNRWHECLIEDNKDTGIEFNGYTRDNVFEGCVIRNTEEDDKQPIAVVYKENTENITFTDCTIQGEIVDNRKRVK